MKNRQAKWFTIWFFVNQEAFLPGKLCQLTHKQIILREFNDEFCVRSQDEGHAQKWDNQAAQRMSFFSVDTQRKLPGDTLVADIIIPVALSSTQELYDRKISLRIAPFEGSKV